MRSVEIVVYRRRAARTMYMYRLAQRYCESVYFKALQHSTESTYHPCGRAAWPRRTGRSATRACRSSSAPAAPGPDQPYNYIVLSIACIILHTNIHMKYYSITTHKHT